MVLRKLLFTLTLLLTLTLSPLQAQEGQDQPARDVRVVVDISGSMKVNDPDNLRRPAVRLLARLLPQDTGVGLWTFGSMVNMLVPHDALDDDQRATLIEDSEQINSVAQRTNIGAAIKEAADDWYAPDRSLSNTHLILLSDGKVDISASQASNDRERQRILEDLVPGLAGRGLTIHTIALSGEADLDLLGAIADMTGGVARVADSAEALSRIFADTMGQAVPANEVPLDNNRFTVDSGVEEFTALIFSATPPDQRQLTLVGPGGQRYQATENPGSVRWAREAGYDLITVDQPAAGEWQLEGTLGEGSRVTVVSDLRLQVEPMPARFTMGEEVELTAFFTEEGERIADPDFLGVITVSLSMTTEDGRRGTRVLSEDQPPADGRYRDTIARLPEPGQYLLELEADGSTFSRKFRKTLVLESPPGAPATGPGGEGIPLEQEQDEMTAAPEPEAPSSEPPASGPVDLSQLEEPEPAPQPQTEPTTEPEPPAEPAGDTETPPEPSLMASLMAWWPWAAAAVGGLVAAVVAWLLYRRRRGNSEVPEDGLDATAEAAAEKPATAETAVDSDGEQEDSEVPPELPPEPEISDLESEDESLPQDSAATEESAGVVDDADEQPVPEDAEEVDQSLPAEEPVQDVVPDEVSDAQDEPEESVTAEAEEPPGEPDKDTSDDWDGLPEDDDDEEFGLEDFDLSDIDDLPDLETDENDEEPDRPSRDENRKKE